MEDRLAFQEFLKQSLDTYHPGWDVRFHASGWHTTYWKENQRLVVWVDTLKRWVEGEHFPQMRKFEEFVEKAEFPDEVGQHLLKLFHAVRRKLRNKPKEISRLVTSHCKVIGQRPISSVQQFVGRHEQIYELSRMLGDRETCLVTIVGRSGIGKTALACQVLQAIEMQRWSHTSKKISVDGIVYLSTLGLEHIFSHCVQLLDEAASLHLLWASPIQIEEKIAALLEALSGQLYIILLDNIEDLLDKDGVLIDRDMALFLDQVMRRTHHNIRLLLTSQLEIVFPKDVLHRNQLLPLDDGLSVEDGIALLRKLDPNGLYGLRNASDEVLQRVVERVHGVPRAIEVLVGILEDDRLASPDSILEQFASLPSVRDMIHEGFRRLDHAARRVVEALSVFRRPVLPEAIVFLLEPFSGDLDVQGVIQRLIRTRMLSADRTSGVVALHPIDADYAYSQLPETGIYNCFTLEERAAVYYQQARSPAESWESISDLMPQIFAYEHYLKAGDFRAAALQLEPDTYAVLMQWGHVQRVITLRQPLVGKLGDLELENLFGLAKAFHAVGQFTQAIETYQHVLKHNPNNLAQPILIDLGDIYQQLEHFNIATDYYQRALKTGNDVSALMGLASVYHQIGDDKQAMTHIQSALALAEQADNPKVEAECMAILSRIYRNLGEQQQSLAYAHEILEWAQTTKERYIEGEALSLIGIAYADLGQYSKAFQSQHQALEVADRIGDLYGKCRRLVRLCALSIEQGNYDIALKYGHESLEVAKRIGARRVERCSLLYLARVDIALGHFENARDKLVVATAIASETQNHVDRQSCSTRLAEAYLHLGQLEEAHLAIQAALRYPLPLNHHTALALNGVIAARRGDKQEAQTSFNLALATAYSMLERTPHFFNARYARGLAYAGLAVVGSGHEVTNHLWHAQEAYQDAYAMCSAPGVVTEALCLLDELKPLSEDDMLETLKAVMG